MDEHVDIVSQLIHDVDQYLCNVKYLCKVIAAEYHALKDEGVGSTEAALIVGTRHNFS